MNRKISSAFSISVCLLFASIVAFGQSAAPGVQPQTDKQSAQPVVYATRPKLAVGKLKSGESNVYDVRGKATFTITAANDNDTVAGTFVYTIPDDARQKIAQISSRPLNSIPASVTKRDVIAGFQNDTACPVLHLEIGATEFDLGGVKLHFNRIVIDVLETTEEVPQHLCAWARQINAKRQRRGIIASLNRLISGEQ